MLHCNGVLQKPQHVLAISLWSVGSRFKLDFTNTKWSRSIHDETSLNLQWYENNITMLFMTMVFE